MTTVADLAGDTPLEYTGVLTRDGEARNKVIDGQGHMVPVVCLDMESESALHLPMHIEQRFPAGHMDQAKAAARRYRKGQRVTVQAPVRTIRWAVVASHIHTHHTEEDHEFQSHSGPDGNGGAAAAGAMPRVGESLRLVD